MKIQPLIVVKDVESSSTFYQRLLNCESGHGGSEYEMLLINGALVLQLHAQDTHEHEGLFNERYPCGNGVILWFRTNEFSKAVERARLLEVEVVSDPHINPNANQPEFWFRDPDGYLVVLAGNTGDVL
ncbi:MAG: VOC family protein [Myxococcota bacterium]|nr:VOC family protein [Myxococcota bacterium]